MRNAFPVSACGLKASARKRARRKNKVMSDTDETKRPGKTLSLKKTETSTVKQSFSHGRTKAVVVEKKRSAVPPKPSAPAAKTAEKTADKPAAAKADAPKAAAPAR